MNFVFQCFLNYETDAIDRFQHLNRFSKHQQQEWCSSCPNASFVFTKSIILLDWIKLFTSINFIPPIRLNSRVLILMRKSPNDRWNLDSYVDSSLSIAHTELSTISYFLVSQVGNRKIDLPALSGIWTLDGEKLTHKLKMSVVSEQHSANHWPLSSSFGSYTYYSLFKLWEPKIRANRWIALDFRLSSKQKMLIWHFHSISIFPLYWVTFIIGLPVNDQNRSVLRRTNQRLYCAYQRWN